MNCEKTSMLTYLSELDFALVETNRYIGTHKTDHNALILYNTLVNKYKNLECSYESKYGPITSKAKDNYT